MIITVLKKKKKKKTTISRWRNAIIHFDIARILKSHGSKFLAFHLLSCWKLCYEVNWSHVRIN